jgi:hypothetical protein
MGDSALMIKHPSDNLKRGQACDLQFFYTLTNNWLLMGNRTNRKPDPDLNSTTQPSP